jgi:CheY-like chemotaxis protein
MATILVIDDEPELLAVLRETLTRAGHAVLTATGPAEGLALYRSQRPDVVLTDIFMPNVGGLAVLLELAREAAVKVIAMSGGGARGLVQVLEDAPAFGAWRTLRKPFSRTELLGLVDEALGTAAPGRGVA